MNDDKSINVPPDEQDIHAYVDGRMDDASRARMDAWLDRHPGRAEAIRRWRHDAQQLRAALAGLPDTAGQGGLDPAAVRTRRRHRKRTRMTTAALLVLTLAIGAVGGWQAHTWTMPAPAPPMGDALQAYRMFASAGDTDLDVTQGRLGSLQRWLDQHFEHAAQLPDLTGAGFHTVGARLIATATGPAAMVVYKNTQGQAIGFYIRPPSRRKGFLPRGKRRAGRLVVAYWSDSSYNYALVSHADAPQLRAVNQAS